MKYVIPELEVVGAGCELVQAMYGPYNDFGATFLSLGFAENDEQE
jgi:hypothetical protein